MLREKYMPYTDKPQTFFHSLVIRSTASIYTYWVKNTRQDWSSLLCQCNLGFEALFPRLWGDWQIRWALKCKRGLSVERCFLPKGKGEEPTCFMETFCDNSWASFLVSQKMIVRPWKPLYTRITSPITAALWVQWHLIARCLSEGEKDTFSKARPEPEITCSTLVVLEAIV